MARGSWGQPVNDLSRRPSRAVVGAVWDRKHRGFWGNFFASYPEALLAEVDGPKCPDRITEVSRGSYARKG